MEERVINNLLRGGVELVDKYSLISSTKPLSKEGFNFLEGRLNNLTGLLKKLELKTLNCAGISLVNKRNDILKESRSLCHGQLKL